MSAKQDGTKIAGKSGEYARASQKIDRLSTSQLHAVAITIADAWPSRLPEYEFSTITPLLDRLPIANYRNIPRHSLLSRSTSLFIASVLRHE